MRSSDYRKKISDPNAVEHNGQVVSFDEDKGDVIVNSFSSKDYTPIFVPHKNDSKLVGYKLTNKNIMIDLKGNEIPLDDENSVGI